jgi:hypothetical protein
MAVTFATVISLTKFGPVVAIPLALLPFALLFVSESQRVLVGAMIVLGATLIGGHDFSYIRVGPLYILDATLFVVFLLSLPELGRAIRRQPAMTYILSLILAMTLFHLIVDGLSEDTLRRSVIGLYALWAFIGAVIAYRGLTTLFARLIYVSAVGTTVVYGMWLVHPTRWLISLFEHGFVEAAASLYLGFAILLALLQPELVPGPLRRFRVPLLALQLTELAIGEVRSIWIAFPLALFVVVAVCGRDPARTRRFLRYGFASIVAAIAVAVVVPKFGHALSSEASSIYSRSSSAHVSYNNTQWRLAAWRTAWGNIQRHPLVGNGFTEPTITYEFANTRLGADPHNSFLAFGVRFGFVGLTLLILLEFLVLRMGREAARGANGGIVRWLVACQLLVGFHALFTVVLEGPYMGLFFWLFAGLVVGAMYHGTPEEAPAEKPGSAQPALG